MSKVDKSILMRLEKYSTEVHEIIKVNELWLERLNNNHHLDIYCDISLLKEHLKTQNKKLDDMFWDIHLLEKHFSRRVWADKQRKKRPESL